jgi:nucleoside 2-deoxyribosyltransferase
MKVYLASSFTNRVKVATFHTLLTDHGITATSRWYWVGHQTRSKSLKAAVDLLDIMTADALLLLNWDGDRATTGKMFEVGFALGLGKPVHVLGKLTTVDATARAAMRAGFRYARGRKVGTTVPLGVFDILK